MNSNYKIEFTLLANEDLSNILETLSALGYRKIHVKNYVVIYSVDESNMTVTVLRIFYEKSDYISKLL